MEYLYKKIVLITLKNFSEYRDDAAFSKKYKQNLTNLEKNHE